MLCGKKPVEFPEREHGNYKDHRVPEMSALYYPAQYYKYYEDAAESSQWQIWYR